jgi:phosphonate transport system substrate-binding protein
MPTNLRSLIALPAAALLATALTGVDALAQDCLNWGDLDKQLYCDESRDLVADTPARGFQLKSPDTLVFSFAPVGDQSAYKAAFAGFMDHLSRKTGKTVTWRDAASSAEQIKAMRDGTVHIAGVSPGPTVYAVNLAGYVPIAVMCKSDGAFGYQLNIISAKDSSIQTLSEVKGRKVAEASKFSSWGDEAAHAMFRQKHVVPGKDFEIVQSGSDAASIKGVADGTYEAAAVNSNVLARMRARGAVDGAKIRLVWASQSLPPTSYGFANNLAPDLQRKIHDAFLTYDWKGTPLAAEFGSQAEAFCTVSYKEEWGPIRLMQKESGVVYDVKNL